MPWLLLVLTLPTENATARMRAWRALKASGAAVLRDGVYLLPEREACRATLQAVAADVQTSGGSAYLLAIGEAGSEGFPRLFDRQEAYAELLADIGKARLALGLDTVPDLLKTLRRLRKTLAGIVGIDFFPGEARRQTEAALSELESLVDRSLAPGEPHASDAVIRRLALSDYRGRFWATRQRPWIDRLASAWLIRRFIDPEARFLWLATPAECPAEALGFDFDGATFTHVDAKVTFEVLLASFGLDAPALQRVGALVHYLDVGGVQPAEACGVEQIVAGLQCAMADDDRLLQAACGVFDGLYAAFDQEVAVP